MLTADYYSRDSLAAVLEGLIERNCPRLMMTGGGHLMGAGSSGGPQVRLTPDQRSKAVELAKTGQYSATEIARMIGGTQSGVYKALEKAGVRARDGRKTR